MTSPTLPPLFLLSQVLCLYSSKTGRKNNSTPTSIPFYLR